MALPPPDSATSLCISFVSVLRTYCGVALMGLLCKHYENTARLSGISRYLLEFSPCAEDRRETSTLSAVVPANGRGNASRDLGTQAG